MRITFAVNVNHKDFQPLLCDTAEAFSQYIETVMLRNVLSSAITVEVRYTNLPLGVSEL